MLLMIKIRLMIGVFLLKNEFTIEKAKNFSNALRLYSDNTSCEQYNRNKIISLGKLIFS
jgi:hypothetical protein